MAGNTVRGSHQRGRCEGKVLTAVHAVADGANLRKSDCEEDFRPLKAKLTVVDRLRRLQAAELAQPMQMG